jgi:hypothetical protein
MLAFLVPDSIEHYFKSPSIWLRYAFASYGAAIVNMPFTFVVMAIFRYQYKQHRKYGKVHLQCYCGAFVLLVLIG